MRSLRTSTFVHRVRPVGPGTLSPESGASRPYLLRGSRRNASSATEAVRSERIQGCMRLLQELEFRLFSSRKNRRGRGRRACHSRVALFNRCAGSSLHQGIIGCVGEPLRVLVSHQARSRCAARSRCLAVLPSCRLGSGLAVPCQKRRSPFCRTFHARRCLRPWPPCKSVARDARPSCVRVPSGCFGPGSGRRVLRVWLRGWAGYDFGEDASSEARS